VADAEVVVLEGLDGATPLGFLAAIGVLQVLAGRARDSSEGAPLLSWKLLDAWRPVLHGPASFAAVVAGVHEDAVAWEAAQILRFRYVKIEKNGPKVVGGLRPPLAVLRRWLHDLREAGDEISLAHAGALLCETTSDLIENAPTMEQLREHGIEADPSAPLDHEPGRTFFDFTARNAQFLEQVDEIRRYLDLTIVEKELRSGQVDTTAPRSMDWDSTADTPGAIYTGYSRGFLPVAEWLAFRGLVAFSVSSRGTTMRTAACTGRRLAGEFIWPLWEVPTGSATVQSLVAYPALADLDAAERRALGIAALLKCELTKKADGYSGMFSPSRPA
jgi:hypothetical protein